VAVITVEADPTERHRTAILDPLAAFNAKQAGEPAYSALALLLRDAPQAEIRGGLWGEIYFGWLFVELLFVPEDLRGQGLGSRLLAEAETIARQRGCAHVWLDTFTFQAPDFYRRLGYAEFGRLGHYPNRTERIFLSKPLA
jgi:GNAT superfamily N-acetyltransferase